MCQGPVLHDEETTDSRLLRIYRTLPVAWGSPNEAFLRYSKINKCQWNFLQLTPAVGTIQEKNKRLDHKQMWNWNIKIYKCFREIVACTLHLILRPEVGQKSNTSLLKGGCEWEIRSCWGPRRLKISRYGASLHPRQQRGHDPPDIR